ncbi:MAG: alpha-L-fucosidase [Anaerolineae bacterium]|nr:alpha-L-fucosidase [Anaerolineae bacterium]
MNKNRYLSRIEDCIAHGHYKATWQSLCQHPEPAWYRNAKFGIFIHWGVYSVPAFGGEWYPRQMYLQGTPEFEHHRQTYGEHKSFGYKDFIPLFKAENFDAGAWMDLFASAGARYVMPVAEHHDGFQMYDSQLSRWNAANMGPKRDILRELKTAADAAGITFCVSSHRAEHFWFFDGGLQFESDVLDLETADFYGPPQHGSPDHHDLYANPPSREHMEDWLVRTCELVDQYQPRVVWFDWWIQHTAFKPYLRKFAAYYYNRALEWGVEVAINNKYDAYAYGSTVFDIERGQLSEINPRLWQNDTAIAKNSWGYTHNNDFKTARSIIQDLVDIVSKNGCLLLNVGPRPDGTIAPEETAVLREIGNWLRVNGEGIYDTTHWKTFGEGPTQVPQGAFTDTNRTDFTEQDIRFTYKGGVVYAFVMQTPASGKVRIKSFNTRQRVSLLETPIERVTILGHPNPVTGSRNEESCDFTIEGRIESDYPICFKVELA